MKRYEEPIMEVTTFTVEDVVTISDNFGDDNNIGGDNELEEDEG